MIEDKCYEVCVSEKEVDGIQEKVQFLEVTILGAVSLGRMMSLMSEIKKVTSEIKGKYVSVTDMRELNVSKLLQNIILYGMESSYASLLAVKNPASLSFVLLNESQLGSASIKDRLLAINEQNKSGKKKYTYIFVQSLEEVFQKVRDTYPK